MSRVSVMWSHTGDSAGKFNLRVAPDKVWKIFPTYIPYLEMYATKNLAWDQQKGGPQSPKIAESQVVSHSIGLK